MSGMPIGDPISFFAQLGGLHDVEIEKLALESDTLALRVGDLLGNFEGLRGYRGPLPGTLTFRHVDNIEIAIESSDCLTIFSLDLAKLAADRWDLEVRLVPGGRIHLHCSAIEGDFDPDAVRGAVPSD